MDEGIRRFLDDLAVELHRSLGGDSGSEVTWASPLNQTEPFAQDLGWWTATRDGNLGVALAAGAFVETWEGLGRGGDSENSKESGYSRFSQALQSVFEKHFGSPELDSGSGPSQEPPPDWVRVTLELERSEHRYPPILCCLSPELQKALLAEPPADDPIKPGSPVSMDMLMDVEVPVRVSFGSTRIRMKELLSLNTGSLVELDRALGDRVEILVNRRVIARGEVVAVDGNYGVRILELIAAAGAPHQELTR